MHQTTHRPAAASSIPRLQLIHEIEREIPITLARIKPMRDLPTTGVNAKIFVGKIFPGFNQHRTGWKVCRHDDGAPIMLCRDGRLYHGSFTIYDFANDPNLANLSRCLIRLRRLGTI